MKQTTCITIMVIFLTLMNAQAFGAGQEFQTLELVRTYQSEEEVRKAYPDLFPKTNKIEITEQAIHFIDPDTGKVLKQIQTQQFGFELKEPLTEEEFQQLSGPVIRECISRYLSDDKTLLVVSEGTVEMRSWDYIEEGRGTTTKRTLYNADGDVLTELPPEAGMVVVSPHTRDFVAYNWAEFGGPPSIYFYSSDGTSHQRQEIFEQARVRFSQNGEFVTVFEDTKKFAIFTKIGELVYQGNSRELIQEVNAPLGGVFVSEKAERMLLTTSQHIHLYTIQGKSLWKTPSPASGQAVQECCFFSQKGVVAVKIRNRRIVSGPDYYNVQIHSLETGEIIDEITGVAGIASINDRLIVTKGEQHYEYQLH